MLVAMLVAVTMGAQDSIWVGRERYFGANDDQYVYEVKQDDVVLDFKNGAILSGKPPSWDQATYTGVGLLIKGHKNVTIRNLKVSGYRFNFKIVDCENIRLENCTASGSRSIAMRSNGRDLDTFLNLRDTEAWRTYGAGFWIENTKGLVLKQSKSKGSQNGLVMLDTTNSMVIENDFSFNSGWGIALGRSSDNVVCWNRADFVNRPWGGFWGGDSAGLAMADGSCRNYIVGNSLTHSGDGFFLTHRGDKFDEANRKIEIYGPSNDNVIAHNDGSWSTANAFEGTFSSGNVYYKNWANASSAAGFWLGYSDDSLLLDNEIVDSQNNGVAIEHGRMNVIENNRIEGSAWAGIGLWAAEDWRGRAKPSEANDSVGNHLQGNREPYNLRGGRNPYLKDEIVTIGPGSVASSANPNNPSRRDRFEKDQLPRLNEILAMRPKDFKFYREENRPQGIDWIQADTFAPRDFSADVAAWRQSDPGSIELYLQELGARVAVPGFAQFDPTPDNPRLVRISAKPESATAGEDRAIGINISSRERKQKQLIKTNLRTVVWDVKWFDWSGMNYDDADAWKRLFDSKPLTTESTRKLGGDYSGRSPAAGVPNNHFACVATTRLKTESGPLIFSTISDDGIRVFVDGREIISRWNHHGPTPDEISITLDEGIHDIRVEYCQEGGAAILKVDWHKPT